MTERRDLTFAAKKLRRDMTDAERKLWQHIRAHRFLGLKFKRQEPLGSYVVDFICYDAKLIIELDGGQHASQLQEDADRTRWLESRGFRVLRFWNNDLMENNERVLQEIEKTVRPFAIPPKQDP